MHAESAQYAKPRSARTGRGAALLVAKLRPEPLQLQHRPLLAPVSVLPGQTHNRLAHDRDSLVGLRQERDVTAATSSPAATGA